MFKEVQCKRCFKFVPSTQIFDGVCNHCERIIRLEKRDEKERLANQKIH